MKGCCNKPVAPSWGQVVAVADFFRNNGSLSLSSSTVATGIHIKAMVIPGLPVSRKWQVRKIVYCKNPARVRT